MHEAMLYEKLPNDRVQCHVCQYRCKLSLGKSGVCRVRENRGGVLYTRVYGEISSMAVDPVEKRPLFHFYPGSKVFSLGTWGCNFRCVHCQNEEISFADPETGALLRGKQTLSPADAVRQAQENGCQGICWTYNEPTIWFEYTYDCARLAKEKGLYTAYVTNGFITEEALDTIGPYLDAWRVDIKGFSKDFYRRLARVADFQGILDMAVRAKEKWGMHVETVTNVIPGWNDDDVQLRGVAEWTAGRLGPLTPWHVTRFYPHAELSGVARTPVATLERAVRFGREAGLKVVYLGNVPGHEGESTHCYNCGHPSIERWGYQVQLKEITGTGNCANCGADLNVRGVTR
jgi:pyruvate formate lyase activating enzyme